MKRILTIITAVFCLCGCEKFFTPTFVMLSSEGETVTVETIIFPETLGITDYDGEGIYSPEYDEETETFTVTYDWLTASIAKASYDGDKGYKMVLTARKNTTGKRRTLYVGGMHGNLQQSMDVTQKQ